MILLYVKEKENLPVLNIGKYSFQKVYLSAFHILCFTQNPYFFLHEPFLYWPSKYKRHRIL